MGFYELVKKIQIIIKKFSTNSYKSKKLDTSIFKKLTGFSESHDVFFIQGLLKYKRDKK